MSAVEVVRNNTKEGCHTPICQDSGCSLSMENAPEPSVLLHLEHEAAPIGKDQAHCDFLFVGDGGGNSLEWVAPIELTTGEHRAEKFKRQLQAGAALAETLIPGNIRVAFRPIAVYGKANRRKAERNRMKNPAYFIEFRCEKKQFKLVQCGSQLVDALKGG